MLDDDQDKFILFKIGDKVFGTPLLNVREIVEYRTPKPLPNTQPSFMGVINLRGEIIGLIDTRTLFGENKEINRNTALMVFETTEGTLAAIVDRVESVAVINKDNIDKKSGAHAGISNDHLIGIAKHDENLITLFNFGSLIASAA